MNTRDTILRLTFMALVGLGLVTSVISRAQEPVTTSPFVVYFDEDSLITDSIRVDGVIYVALVDLVRRMALPYTDATAAATFTIRAPGGTLVASRNDRRVTIGGGSIELSGRVVREDGRWFVPPDFITVALYRVGGTAFRYRSGSARMIAADIAAPEIRMGADRIEDSTRLTVRAGASVNVRVQQDPDSNRVVLAFDRAPLDPIIETLDYGDAAIRSVTYDDARAPHAASGVDAGDPQATEITLAVAAVAIRELAGPKQGHFRLLLVTGLGSPVAAGRTKDSTAGFVAGGTLACTRHRFISSSGRYGVLRPTWSKTLEPGQHRNPPWRAECFQFNSARSPLAAWSRGPRISPW